MYSAAAAAVAVLLAALGNVLFQRQHHGRARQGNSVAVRKYCTGYSQVPVVLIRFLHMIFLEPRERKLAAANQAMALGQVLATRDGTNTWSCRICRNSYCSR